MLQQTTRVIPRPQPQQESTENDSASNPIMSGILDTLVGMPIGSIMDALDSDDNAPSIETELTSGSIAGLQKHPLAQHMGSVLSAVSAVDRESERDKDRAKAKKHPNYIDPSLFLQPRAKPVKE